MFLFDTRNLLFAAKAFGASMLALYIAFAMDLPRPSWSMLTVFIVAQPYTGMVMSKAAYRVLGTVIGSVVAVIATTTFSGSPELLSLFMALWVGFCVYVTVLDRTPRSYAFMLAGYTAGIIAFPVVDTPYLIFDTAIARCQEIILGILCMVVVSQVVFPQRVGTQLMGRLTAWLDDAGRWSADVLTEASTGAAAEADRHRLIVNAAALDALRVHASYDTPEMRTAEAGVRRLQRRLQMLLSNVVSTQDRLVALRRDRPDLADGLRPLLGDVSAWIQGPGEASNATGGDAVRDGLLARIDAAAPSDTDIRRDADALLVRSLLARVRDLITYWDESGKLRAAIQTGARVTSREGVPSLHRDHLAAALSGVAAVVSVALCVGFWIATGWSHGYLAAMMSAVGASLFATLDNPAQATAKFLNLAVVAMVIASGYLLFVLPAVTSFPILVLVLVPVFIPLAAAMASPLHFPVALPVLITTAATLALQNSFTIDYADFVNGGIAQVVGLGSAVVALKLVRSLGADWTVHRLMAAIRHDLARLAAGDARLDRHRFEGRMYDRLSGLVPRLALVSAEPEGRDLMRDALAGLRVGLNLLALRRDRSALPKGAAEELSRVLAAVGGHFASSGGERSVEELRGVLDAAVARLSAMETGDAGTEVLLSLFGIRQALVHFQRPA
ncbi:fusaric acid resistance protein [Skermanella stibiiresistens SB22]|uniref:Fusaric acid resistance protein n=1 Tax=Skermanella stibiiresistens SB22 TaxID=1385369 RepID=W9H6S5_9PROT|nr:FUSC family protein [Skermanella stibiiresistens]EWY41935.1 fusaric acid resistance protein [Skermanella stibiiresistens SB22]